MACVYKSSHSRITTISGVISYYYVCVCGVDAHAMYLPTRARNVRGEKACFNRAKDRLNFFLIPDSHSLETKCDERMIGVARAVDEYTWPKV